jgi:adenylate cyclase
MLDIKKGQMDKVWYWYLTGETIPEVTQMVENQLKLYRTFFSLLPGSPRCIECTVPLQGPGTLVAKPLGFTASSFSPLLCNSCEKYLRKHEGGAEVELTMLFADIRNSTHLAENLPSVEFSKLIQRFYKVTASIIVKHNGFVNRLMGDQVIGLFTPRFAGNSHGRVAMEVAKEILIATGHGPEREPWAPVGIGLHTGLAYVGIVGSRDGVNEMAVLGNAANLTARLASQASAGEIVISEYSANNAGIPTQSGASQTLTLKGISHPVGVRVVRI